MCDIDNVQNWSDDLLESWDACVFTPESEKDKQRVDTKETHQSASGSVFDSEELPSNQEAYRQQLQP
ncbi:MAG: hypothetical protein ACRC0X_03425, partial [Brevinema sp.]